MRARLVMLRSIQTVPKWVIAILVLAVLLAPTIAFLLLTHFLLDAPLDRTLHHGQVMVVADTLLTCALMIASNGRRSFRVVWRTLNFFVWGCIITTLSFYSLITVSISSWGKIPTLGLISTYVVQLEAILSTLSAIDKGVWVLGLLLLLLLSCLLTWLVVKIVMVRSAGIGGHSSLPIDRWRFIGAYSLVAVAITFVFVHAVDARTVWAADYFHVFLKESDVEASTDMLLPLLWRIGDPDRRKIDDAVRASYVPAALRNKPNVIVVVVDALRADHMTLYGYERETTPLLTLLSKREALSIQHEARSACAESTCGILSLLSGRYCHELLVRSFDLPSVLSLHGYRRTFFLSGDHTNFYNLRGAYGDVDQYWDGSIAKEGYVNDDRLLLRRLSELPDATSEQPHFLYLHLMSVHGLGYRDARFKRWTPVASPYGAASFVGGGAMEGYINQYDNGVLQADSIVTDIIQTLERKRYLTADAILVITADHGESLGEHGVVTHVSGVHEAVLRIPMLWYGSLGKGLDLTRSATQADVAPTILKHMGVPIPVHWTGRPLQRSEPVPQESLTVHVQPPQAAVVGYKEGIARYKYVRNYQTNTRYFYDLHNDPKESKPLAKLDSLPAIGKDMDALLSTQRFDQLVMKR